MAAHCIRQFPLHFPSRAPPCAIAFQLDSTTRNYLKIASLSGYRLCSWLYRSGTAIPLQAWTGHERSRRWRLPDFNTIGTRRYIYIYIYIFIYLFTAIGLSPGGSGYFTYKQIMKLVTDRFKSGGLHEKHVVATWNVGNHLSICL